MSQHKATLSETIKQYMKARDKERLQFARNLHAAIRKVEIDSKVELDDAGFEAIVKQQVKQRRDSLDQFEKAGRSDLVLHEQAELDFLNQFLPEPLSLEETKVWVQKAIQEVGATSVKDTGKIMGFLSAQVGNRVEGAVIAKLVRETFSPVA